MPSLKENALKENSNDIFKTILDIRNFEIDLFWKRSNYFLVLNTSIAVGYFTASHNEILIASLGLVICCLWFLVTLGGKFWQSRWEHQLSLVEKDLGLTHVRGQKYSPVPA